jgi:micrococcal nuclease
VRTALLPVAVVSCLVLAACSSGSSQSSETSASLAASTSATTPADLPTDLVPQGEVVSGLVVDRVVDGDTIKVTLDGEQVSVRLIGMNTPETVKPGAPVECYGPESSDYAKRVLTGQPITLEFDASQGRFDRYDRTLAYVWRELPDGDLELFNLELIAGGYARERQYGSSPYEWKAEFEDAQRRAQSSDRGLWGACDDS